MATRLDRVTSNKSRLDEDVDLQPTALAPRHSSLDMTEGQAWLEAATARPNSLTVGTLGGAMAAWFSLVFGLCYVVIPSITSVLGWQSGVINSFWYNLPAFALASLATIVGVLVAQPRIRFDEHGGRDPVIAATIGGLGVFTIVHNTSSLFGPFSAMSPVELASLLGMNVLEMSLLGMMFASFTKRASVALALGGGFQLLVLGIALTLMAII